MGQKVNPVSLRLGITRTWNSLWYANKSGYAAKLHSDLVIRKMVRDQFSVAGISSILIERLSKKVRVVISVARPGLIIGKNGEDVEKLKKKLSKVVDTEVILNIVEVKAPELDANIVADTVAQQLEKRVSFRKVMKRSVQSAMRMGAEGIKISVAGRLGGAEIARTEWYMEGCVPLHTLRADIDYAIARANTTYGVLGIKVWIYRGDAFNSKDFKQKKV